MKKRWLIGAVALTLAGCGGNLSGGVGGSGTNSVLGDGSGGNTQASSASVDASALSLGDSISFSLSTQNNGTLSFGSDASNQGYLLVMATPSKTNTNSVSFSLSSESETPNSQLALMADVSDAEEADDAANEPDFHDYMRALEETLPAADSDAVTVDTQALTVETKRLSAGDEKTFKILNSLGSTDSCSTVTAEAVLVTDHVALYVDTRISLTQDEIDTYAALDSVIADEIEIGGESGDMDGNGVINAVITPVVNGIDTTGGGVVTGFFNPIDHYSASKYRCSNQAEAVYLIAPDPNKDWGTVSVSRAFWKSNFSFTLQHEVQHLLNYHQRVFALKTTPETSWLNEALSHKLEDLRPGQDFSEIGLENPSRVLKFLQDTDGTNMTSGTNLAQRGEGYLFLDYLFKQADKGTFSTVTSGKDLLAALIASDKKGADNVEEATGETFDELFGRFALAMAISGRSFDADPLYNFDVNVYKQAFDDNRGTRWAGPVERDYSEGSFEMKPNSVSFISITGEEIARSGGTIAISGGAGGSVIAHLIRTN